MHEFNVCQSIVDTVNKQLTARGREKCKVIKTTVVIGALRPIVSEYLTLTYAHLTKGTIAEGSELAVRRPPANGKCRQCGSTSMVTGRCFRCQQCGANEGEITGGRELYIDHIELQG
ncbi:MAG: hydrogenase maturation nickel metallochaperone HypA [Chitinispirillaceae bacterium]|nr:hydrogenase maturation nickel metallochaperone HypA [Chitinispirillaceae bacterium]